MPMKANQQLPLGFLSFLPGIMLDLKIFFSSPFYLSFDTASPSLLSIMRRGACERIKVKKIFKKFCVMSCIVKHHIMGFIVANA